MGQMNKYKFYFYNLDVSSLHFFFGIGESHSSVSIFSLGKKTMKNRKTNIVASQYNSFALLWNF